MDDENGLPSSGDPGLPPEDYIEISQLYGLYARDVDPGSPRNASWLFTDDALFVVAGMMTLEGRPALAEFYEKIRTDQARGMRHFNTSYVIRKAGEGAIASGYMLWVSKPTAKDPWEVTGSGVYEDYLVRTPAGWRFKKRVYHADTDGENPEPFPTAPLG
jgi:ketosteroid isomerase-like protein